MITNILWSMGIGTSIAAGVAIGFRHGADIGIAVGYALMLLVDIRKQTDK